MQYDDTRTAMEFAGLTAYETWAHYCNMGGATDYFEFDAYLHGLYPLDAGDADLISQAVNELLDDACPAGDALLGRAPYSWSQDTATGPAPDELAVGSLTNRPGVPLPPGAAEELLRGILDVDTFGRTASKGRK